MGFPVGRYEISDLGYLRNYFEFLEIGAENMKLTESTIFNYKIKLKNGVSFQEFISKLPDIRHFIKYGDKCASRCKAQCNYCYDCAENIKELIV